MRVLVCVLVIYVLLASLIEGNYIMSRFHCRVSGHIQHCPRVRLKLLFIFPCVCVTFNIKCYLKYKMFGFLSKKLASLMRKYFPILPSVAPLHTLSKVYDIPVRCVTPPSRLRQCFASFPVAEGWLLLDIGRFVLFLTMHCSSLRVFAIRLHQISSIFTVLRFIL